MMNTSKMTINGLDFEAIRATSPIKHWKLKTPTGAIWDSGVGFIDGRTRPKLWASLQYMSDRLGKDRFIREFTNE